MSAAAREPWVLVSKPEGWAAVASPIRIEIIEFMRSAGPCSVAELGHLLDRPADGLYHHLRKLMAAGIVREVGTRHVGRQIEAVYDLCADDLRFDFDPATGRNAQRFKKIVAALVRLTGRTAEAAIDGFGSDPPSSFRTTIETAWLDDADIEAVGRHLRAIDEILAKGRTQRRGRLMTITSIFVPAVRTRRGRPLLKGGKGVRGGASPRTPQADAPPPGTPPAPVPADGTTRASTRRKRAAARTKDRSR